MDGCQRFQDLLRIMGLKLASPLNEELRVEQSSTMCIRRIKRIGNITE